MGACVFAWVASTIFIQVTQKLWWWTAIYLSGMIPLDQTFEWTWALESGLQFAVWFINDYLKRNKHSFFQRKWTFYQMLLSYFFKRLCLRSGRYLVFFKGWMKAIDCGFGPVSCLERLVCRGWVSWRDSLQGRVPSWARVMLDRRPNVYDTEALRLKVDFLSQCCWDVYL